MLKSVLTLLVLSAAAKDVCCFQEPEQFNIIEQIISIITNLLPHFPKLPSVTNLPQNVPWGDAGINVVDESIRPFQVQFSDESIADLRSRIDNRRPLLRPLINANNTIGTNSIYLEEILNYWSKDYNFKARQDHLNVYPQYITNIQGLDIKYIHIKPVTHKRSIPILLVHGSPLTTFEYHSLISYLMRQDRAYVFEIIAADLPGYGYSQHTNKQGLAGYQIGIIFKNLMKRLGHEKFVIHGGDVGILVCQAMAAMYPDDIIGYHTNLAVSLVPKTILRYLRQMSSPFSGGLRLFDKIKALVASLRSTIASTANIHQHATRPDQIGIALDDSPTALASWIIPFFMAGGAGADENLSLFDGNISKNFDLNEIIDSLTIYFDRHCMTTVARFYVEEFNFSDPIILSIFMKEIPVPLAAIKFKDELVIQPDEYIKDKYPNLVQSKILNYGGHYAAMMNPQDLAESIWTAVPKMLAFRARHSNDYVALD